MNHIKKIIKILLAKIDFLYYVHKMKHKRKFVLINIPDHGNLGDQAIAMAESLLMKDLHIEYCEIIDNMVLSLMDLIKQHITKEDVILIHGGGYLGTLWFSEEERVRAVIQNFPNNKIVIFPQTIYYSSDDWGRQELKKAQNIYRAHKNLYVYVREKYSYEFFKSNFPLSYVYLVPDIVFYMNTQVDSVQKSDQALLVLRNDKEKKISNSQINTITDILHSMNISYKFTDTVIDKKIYRWNRKKELDQKLFEFSSSKFIITDRLHGMIFAYLAKIPCIVMPNGNYKVKGVYEWIKNADYIYFLEDINEIDYYIELIVKRYEDIRDHIEFDFEQVKKVLVSEAMDDKP